MITRHDKMINYYYFSTWALIIQIKFATKNNNAMLQSMIKLFVH